MAIRRAPFLLGKESIDAGARRTVDLPFSLLSNHTPVTLPVLGIHGRRDGPVVFISAAVHGDEVIGVEIIRRLSRHPALRRIKGTLLLVPIVNVLGFVAHSRYLPDGRDLNRSFPGNSSGSLASQLANLFLTEVVTKCDYGMDLHSAAVHRTNLPQLRINPADSTALELAKVFGPPIILEARLRENSLRHTASGNGVPVLLYEAGEALRFDETAIRVGVRGALRVLKHLGMITDSGISPPTEPPIVSSRSSWLRAPEGGVLRANRTSGDIVAAGEKMGLISDPFGVTETDVVAHAAGVIVGRTNLPIVNQGDALFHIARLPRSASDLDTIDAAGSDDTDDDRYLHDDQLA